MDIIKSNNKEMYTIDRMEDFSMIFTFISAIKHTFVRTIGALTIRDCNGNKTVDQNSNQNYSVGFTKFWFGIFTLVKEISLR